MSPGVQTTLAEPSVSEKLPVALYIVATPIGNLGDMTPRALQVLGAVDVIAAEDTRHTQSLLNHFGLRAKLIAVHEHNERQAASGIVNLLAEGKTVALVSDAGTPGVSDPGTVVVKAVLDAGHSVVPIPGACALVAALSASGEGQDGFLFHGFLPAKTADRRERLAQLANVPWALVFHEAPHRVVESVAALHEAFGDTRMLIICRELTKRFETIARLSLNEASAWLQADPNRQRGEFVLVLSKPAQAADGGQQNAETQERARVLRLLLAKMSLRDAVDLAVELTGHSRNAVYELALSIKNEQPS